MISTWAANTVFGKYKTSREKPESYAKWKEGCVGSDEWYAAKRRPDASTPQVCWVIVALRTIFGAE